MGLFSKIRHFTKHQFTKSKTLHFLKHPFINITPKHIVSITKHEFKRTEDMPKDFVKKTKARAHEIKNAFKTAGVKIGDGV